MSDSYWTLTVDGAEQSLEDWGIEDVRAQFVSLAADKLAFRLVVSSINDDVVSVGQIATLRSGREYSGGAYSGGVIRFHGIIVSVSPSFSGTDESFDVEVAGPAYWLERLVYQQEWTSRGMSTNVFLMVNPDFGKPGETFQLITAGEQIADIVDFAIGMGAPMQRGVFNEMPPQPAMYLPMQQKRDLRCIDAIRECLRCAPDVVSWFDYSTVDGLGNPSPTLYFARASDLPVVNLPIDGVTVQGGSITPVAESSVSAVQLNFERVNDVDGQAVHTLSVQVWPPDAWDSGTQRLKAEYALDALVQTFDLDGSRIAHVSQTVVTVPINANHATQSVREAWWKEKLPGLQSETLTDLSITFDGAYDNDWNQLTSWPQYELVEGAVAEWMSEYMDWAEEVNFVATITYKTSAGSGDYVSFKKAVKVKTCVTLNTNGEPRTLTAVSSSEEAEPEPTGLAEYMFDALGQTYYAGRLTLSDVEPDFSVGLGSRVNIVGGRDEWASMNALVQGVSIDVATGTVTLTLGKPPHLEAEKVLGMLRWNRSRRIWQNPAMRGSSGAVSGGNSITLPRQVPGGYESEAHKRYRKLHVGQDGGSSKCELDGDNAKLTITDGTSVLELDAKNGWIKFTRGTNEIKLDITKSAITQTKGGSQLITLDPDDCDGHAVELKPQPKCVEVNGVLVNKTIMALTSEDIS